MVAVGHMTRVLLLIGLAFLGISLVMGLALQPQGFSRSWCSFLLIGGCVYAAVKISALTNRAVQRLSRR